MESDHDNVRQVVEEDRLSSLPDELIHKILSSFDMKFVVKTCVLSSRWKLVWKSMPFLNFSSRIRRLWIFVTHVLSRRNHQTKVSSVKLNFRGAANMACVTMIANYAFAQKVQELTVVSLSSHHDEYPPCLFSSQSLKHFTMNSKEFYSPPETPMDFPALTTMHLSKIRLRGDIFSKCVNLKNLTLQSFMVGVEVFDIITPRLSNLTLISGMCSKVINLNAPQLENLTIISCAIEYLNAPLGLSSFYYTACSYHATPYWSKYLLQLSNDRFHSLNKVTISLFSNCLIMQYTEKDARKTIELLKVLRSVRYLTLGADVVKCISSFPHLLLDGPLPFSNLVCLTIDCSMMKEDEYKVKMSTEAKNFLLENSPSATFIMELPKV